MWVAILRTRVDGFADVIDVTDPCEGKADAVEATVAWGDLEPEMWIEYHRVVDQAKHKEWDNA